MDNETLTSVFAGMRRRLMALAGRMLGNEDDAADAVQETFCRLWLRREKMATLSEVEGVGMVTVRNLCVDSMRKQAKLPMVSLDDDRTKTGGEDCCVSDEDELKAVYDEVNVIMERNLSEVQLAIVRMRECEGRSYEEIAEKLGMQEATVRVNLSRARKLVREIYRNNKI